MKPRRVEVRRRPSIWTSSRGHRIPAKEAVIAVRPGPRLVRWAIALITAFFVVMMFSPLVQEIVRRIRLSGPVTLP